LQQEWQKESYSSGSVLTGFSKNGREDTTTSTETEDLPEFRLQKKLAGIRCELVLNWLPYRQMVDVSHFETTGPDSSGTLLHNCHGQYRLTDVLLALLQRAARPSNGLVRIRCQPCIDNRKELIAEPGHYQQIPF